MPVLAEDDVIRNLDLEQLTSAHQITRDFDVRLTRRRVPARMLVRENDTGRGTGDRRAEHLQRRNETGIQTAEGDQIVTEDAFAGVEHEDDKRLLHRIKSRRLRDVIPPVFDGLFRADDQFHAHAFADADDFELLR